MTREKTSYKTVLRWTDNVIDYHDFSHPVFAHVKASTLDKQTILVNLNQKSSTLAHIHQIKTFVKAYPDADIVYFPCDMQDDALLYRTLKAEIPQMRYYDWTNHTLKESLHLFASCTAGI